jgi:hypothetical protein
VTPADAGTKFFHSNATIRHRQNLITSLQKSDGSLVRKHEDKALHLWESYKERLRTSEFTHSYFDLHSFLFASDNLLSLEEPFTKEENSNIVQNMPTDKSLGPDGFNSDFLKRCWSTVQQDIFELCQGFFDERVCIQSINSSHIVLIPKIDNPTKVGD